MRRGVGLGALLAALALGGLLPAQDAASIMTGISPDQIHFDKVSYQDAARSFNRSNVVALPNQPSPFSPAALLAKVPRVSFPSWVPLVGRKPAPPPVVRLPRRPRTPPGEQ